MYSSLYNWYLKPSQKAMDAFKYAFTKHVAPGTPGNEGELGLHGVCDDSFDETLTSHNTKTITIWVFEF